MNRDSNYLQHKQYRQYTIHFMIKSASTDQYPQKILCVIFNSKRYKNA